MLYGYAPPGVYIRIKNMTNHSIDNLRYSYEAKTKQKIGKIKKSAYKKVFISNLDLLKNEDFIIEDETGKQFVFEKMVNVREISSTAKIQPNYHYHFLKIEDGEDGVKFVEDEEARKRFFEYTQTN